MLNNASVEEEAFGIIQLLLLDKYKQVVDEHPIGMFLATGSQQTLKHSLSVPWAPCWYGPALQYLTYPIFKDMQLFMAGQYLHVSCLLTID